jgi:signal transduction histidine kinase/DNA-binding response OmpR family regulator
MNFEHKFLEPLMKRFLKHSIKDKIIAIFIFSSSVALLLMSVFLFIYNASIAKDELIDKVQVQLKVISKNINSGLVFGDKVSAESTLKAVETDAHISFAVLYNSENGSLFASYSNPDSEYKTLPGMLPAWRGIKESKDYFQIIEPVMLNEKEIGFVLVQVELFKLQSRILNQALIILLTFMISIALALFLATKLLRLVTQPINKLVEITYKIAKTKDYSLRAQRETDDELGILVDAFNHMLTEIKLFSDQRIKAELALEKSHDILQQQVQEQTKELRISMEQATQSSQAKSDFLANMSHEIRTPMNAVIGMSYLTLQTQLTDKQKKYVNNINTAANSLLGIINDILDFSKIEAGKLEIEKEPFQLASILDNLANLIKEQVNEKGLKLSITSEPCIPDGLMGDPLRLMQILINLVNNAIKFTDKGYVNIEVKLINRNKSSNHEENVILEFTIDDSGIGMTEQQRSKLFHSFSQADNSITRKYGGTGLGLSICKQLTDMMGGSISVESRIGVGTMFKFSLPFSVTDSIAPFDVKKSGNLFDDVDLKNASDIRGARILLVEDNEMNQQVAVELLNLGHFVIKVVGDGQEAVETVKKHGVKESYFDIILMDVQMPVMDGYTATRDIRQFNDLKNLPIIAMTANVMSGDRKKCLDAGMNDHIAKPINPQALYKVLIKWIKPGMRELPEFSNRESKEKVNGGDISEQDKKMNEEHRNLLQMPGIDLKKGLAQVGGVSFFIKKCLLDLLPLWKHLRRIFNQRCKIEIFQRLY